jgi:hypothetical protein
MSKWAKLLGFLRLGAAVAGATGVKVKGVPISVIAEEAEKAGAAIHGAKPKKKATPKKPAPSGSTGE